MYEQMGQGNVQELSQRQEAERRWLMKLEVWTIRDVKENPWGAVDMIKEGVRLQTAIQELAAEMGVCQNYPIQEALEDALQKGGG
jgi:hypothetical protein